MTLQSSGAISLANLASEYTDSQPNSLSEFYRNGGKVPSSITENVAAGSYVTQYNQSTYYWRVGIMATLRWNNVQISSTVASNATTFSSGGFDYQRGAFVGNVTTGSGKTAFTWAYYKIQRRTSATTTTTNVNQNVPTSGTISLSQFYGGRAS